jgi:hypothetical protein
MEPRLIEMAPGGWLALTGPDALVPIGVFGDSKEDALLRLDRAIRLREELHAALNG